MPRAAPEWGGRAWHNGCHGCVVSGSDRRPRHVRGECGAFADGALVGVARGRFGCPRVLRVRRRRGRPERGCPRHRHDRPDDPRIRARRDRLPRQHRRPLRDLVALRGHPVLPTGPRRRQAREHAGGDLRRVPPGDGRHGRHRLVSHPDRRGVEPRGTHADRGARRLHAAPGGDRRGRRDPGHHCLLPDLQRDPARWDRLLPPPRRADEHAYRARHLQAVRARALRIPGLARHLGIRRRSGARLPGARPLAPGHRPGHRRRGHGADSRLLRHAHGRGGYRAGRGDGGRRAAPHGRLRSSRHPHRRVDRLRLG